MIKPNQTPDYCRGCIDCLYQYAHWKDGEMLVGSTGRKHADALAEVQAVATFAEGYERAVREYEADDNPAWENPFPPGSEQNRGYEKGVYDLTQK